MPLVAVIVMAFTVRTRYSDHFDEGGSNTILISYCSIVTLGPFLCLFAFSLELKGLLVYCGC